MFQFCSTFSPHVMTACQVARCFIQQCVPYAPGFELLENCAEFKNSEKYFQFYLHGPFALVYWVTVNFIYFVTFVRLGEGFFFVVVQLYCVQSCCMRYYIRNLLANIASNSNSPSQSMVKVYKQLQLILCYYNQVHQDVFVIVILNLVGVCLVIGSFALISSWNVITNMQFFALTASVSQAVFGLMVCFGNFAEIHEDSLIFIGALRTPRNSASSYLDTKSQLRQKRKVAKSLYPLKVKIGSVNYVDRLTTITFIDFCFGIVVNMLLLK